MPEIIWACGMTLVMVSFTVSKHKQVFRGRAKKRQKWDWLLYDQKVASPIYLPHQVISHAVGRAR